MARHSGMPYGGVNLTRTRFLKEVLLQKDHEIREKDRQHAALLGRRSMTQRSWLRNSSEMLAIAMAIANYFYEALPKDTCIKSIKRWESQQLYLQYESYRETARAELDWSLEDVESWLFNGTYRCHN